MAFRSHDEEIAQYEARDTHQPTYWRVRSKLEKNWLADDADHRAGDREVILQEGNLLVNGGASVIWQRMKFNKPSTSSTGAALQAFSTGNARLGVGNSTAAAAITQNDLSGASKKYNAMASGYPTHTDGTSSSGSRTITYRALYTTAQANFAWGEWGLFNSTGSNKRMLNRKAGSLGTKTSAAQWTFTVSLSLS